MSNIYVGRASELDPKTVERMVSAGVQMALRAIDSDYILRGVHLTQGPDGYWVLSLEADAGNNTLPETERVAARREPEDPMAEWVNP